MSGSLEAVRVFEAEYYGEMPKHVNDMARLRDEGIRQIQEPEEDNDKWHGIDKLGDSVCGLADVADRYERELFASLYMRARGEFIIGEHDYAAAIALEAMGHVPHVPREFADELIADQYVAIASGRLSLILSTSNNGGFAITEREDTDHRKAAIEAARLARITCRHSEDRSRMLFANGEMSEARRRQTRRQFTTAAAAATAGLWLPQNVTVRLAEKVCA